MTKDTAWTWPPRDYSSHPAISRYLECGGSLTANGKAGVIGDCEEALCLRFDQPRALLCCSGTMALYAAFFAAGIESGDEVICPTITFHATVSPALRLGAGVVLVDVVEETACIDPAAAEAAITPRTKVIVTNAQWGHPVEQERIRAICDKHGLLWIEDISHAHGASWNGKQVGTWGDIACMSLGAEKMLTGGMGGAVMSHRDDLMDRAILVTHYLKRSSQDVIDPEYRPLSRTGYGLKLGIHPLAAVVILDQLQHHFDRWVMDRNRSLHALQIRLAEFLHLRPPVILPQVSSMGGWYGFKPWVDFRALNTTRESLVEEFHQLGVEVDIPGSPPLHTLSLFNQPQWNPASSRMDTRSFITADRYSQGTLSLPTFTGDRDQPALDRMVEAFDSVWRKLQKT